MPYSEFQVMETQGRSGLPHEHCLLCCALTPTQRALLTTLQTGDSSSLTMAALQPVVVLGLRAVTVSTCAEDIRHQFPSMEEGVVEEVVGLVRLLQHHRCTGSCVPMVGGLQECSHFYPRPPSLLPLVARRPLLKTEEQQEELARLEAVHVKVQKLVRGGEVERWGEEPVPSLLQLLSELAPAPLDIGIGYGIGIGYYWSGLMFPWGEELEGLLEALTPMAATREQALLLAVYHASLLRRRHPRYIPVRRVSEAWVVGYNPWALAATKANMDADLVVATPSTLTQYLTKGSGMLSLRRAARELEARGGEQEEEMAEALRAAIEAGYREVPLAEAFFRLDSRLHFSSSNTGQAVRVSARLGAGGEVVLSADKERYSLRPAAMEHISLCQYLMWFRLAKREEEQAVPQEGRPTPLIMTSSTPILPHHASFLPTTLTLEDGTVVKRMKQPRVVHVAPYTTYSSILLFKVNSNLVSKPNFFYKGFVIKKISLALD